MTMIHLLLIHMRHVSNGDEPDFQEDDRIRVIQRGSTEILQLAINALPVF